MRISFFLALMMGACAQADPSFHGPGGTLNVPVPINERIGFDQKLNAQVPGGLLFFDENGRSGALSRFFGTRPVVLALVYYNCPNLCSLTISGLFKAMGDISLTAGKDYSVILVSIDPTEGPSLTLAKKRSALRAYGRNADGSGIHFLTGKDSAIASLAAAVGFRYRYDSEHHQYAHPSGIVFLTPTGKVSRYLFGVDFKPENLRLGLAEAGERKIGSAIDAFLLYCYHYDPATGTYTFLIRRTLKIAAALTAIGLAFGIFWMTRAQGAGGRA